MSCESTGKNERRVNQFNKIKLVDAMAFQIASYGVQNGNDTLLDRIDLSCGAIPEGEFEQVIDLSAPHQFLTLYMQIAEKRFAMAVTELLNMNEGFYKPLEDFMEQVGRDMKIPAVSDMDQALNIYDSFVLDGMPCDETKEVLEKSSSKIIWTKLMDTHQDNWNKVGGDLSVYYQLLQDFIKGLFAESGIVLKIDNQLTFTLEKAE